MITAEINNNDAEYREYLDRLAREFKTTASNEPLFTTDANLWDAYLAAFSPEDRRYHNCNTCRAFIERFGGLVTIDPEGVTRSALWHTEATPELSSAVDAMRKLVEKSRVTGVFITDESNLGEREKGKRDKTRQELTGNSWSHLSVMMPREKLHTSRVTTPFQAMAEKLEDAKNVVRALSEFSAELLTQTVQILESDSLYRSEKVLGPAKWLRDLQRSHQSTRNERHRENIVFLAVATAPAGFCHPRSSMIGTLLDDLATGNGFDWAAARFKSKMHPLQYQRPQAAPSAGQIDAAEKLVEKLGIARSLDRRFARLDEIQTIWKPTEEQASKNGGVFGHLKTAATQPQSITASRQSITWVKFASTVLPTSKKIEALAPSRGNYCAFLTAAHDDSPPILQWDTAERRNPVSLYVYHGGSIANQWGLSGCAWVTVTGVSLRPSMWFAENSHHGTGALLVLSGCADTATGQGNALFPETLKSELHGCRSVIEAHSRTAEISGRENASACGLMVSNGSPCIVRVTTAVNTVHEYQIDRWD